MQLPGKLLGIGGRVERRTDDPAIKRLVLFEIWKLSASF